MTSLPFVAELLTQEQGDVIDLRRWAGIRWVENGLVFPSQIGTPLEERSVLRRFQTMRRYDLRHSHASLLINEGVHPKDCRAAWPLIDQADDG